MNILKKQKKYWRKMEKINKRNKFIVYNPNALGLRLPFFYNPEASGLVVSRL